MADVLNIAGRIHSISEEGVSTTADEILDESVNKKQSEINADNDRRISVVEEGINTPASGLKARVETLEEQVSFDGEFEVANNPDDIISGSGKITSASAVRGALNKEIKVTTADTAATDLDIADDQGNVLARIAGGHIKTKNFDSSNISELVGKKITDGEMDEVLGGDVAVYLTDANGNAVLDSENKPIEII